MGKLVVWSWATIVRAVPVGYPAHRRLAVIRRHGLWSRWHGRCRYTAKTGEGEGRLRERLGYGRHNVPRRERFKRIGRRQELYNVVGHGIRLSWTDVVADKRTIPPTALKNGVWRLRSVLRMFTDDPTIAFSMFGISSKEQAHTMYIPCQGLGRALPSIRQK